MIQVEINKFTCIRCGACADICYARDVFEMKDDGPAVIHLLLEEFNHLQHEILGLPANKEIQTLLTLGFPAWEFRRMVPRRMPNILWNP